MAFLENHRSKGVFRIVIHSKNKRLLLFAAATGLLLSPNLSGARSDSAATRTGKSFAKIAPEVEIRRFAEICPGLTRGGEPGEDGLRYLRDRGYRTIVSFLPSSAESAFVVQSGMQYVHIPMRSGLLFAEPPTEKQVDQFLSVVTDTTRYPIFIHCHAGKDRTGAMSAIYRMQVCGWKTDEAVEEMQAFGFSGRYRRLRRFVQEYSGRQVATTTPPSMGAAEHVEPSPATSGLSATPVVEVSK